LRAVPKGRDRESLRGILEYGFEDDESRRRFDRHAVVHLLLARAAIVLCDLGSSAFYAGGIAERAIGEAAPWFILGIMLSAMRSQHLRRKLAMFVRGGVYRVVHEAMGGTLAKFSVSALMFDYVSPARSARERRLYLRPIQRDHGTRAPSADPRRPRCSRGFAIVATLYFWRKNLQGMHESSEKPCASCN